MVKKVFCLRIDELFPSLRTFLLPDGQYAQRGEERSRHDGHTLHGNQDLYRVGIDSSHSRHRR